MSYIFKYKRWFFWKKIKCKGHKLSPELDRMDVFHEDDSITSISQWSKYDLRLDIDWVLFTKKQMSKESGMEVK